VHAEFLSLFDEFLVFMLFIALTLEQRWKESTWSYDPKFRAHASRGGTCRLSGQLLRVQEEERRKIARDLHDFTAQHLVLLTAALERLQNSTPLTGGKSRCLFHDILYRSHRSS
jgi:signal transduction histidine kinase